MPRTCGGSSKARRTAKARLTERNGISPKRGPPSPLPALPQALRPPAGGRRHPGRTVGEGERPRPTEAHRPLAVGKGLNGRRPSAQDIGQAGPRAGSRRARAKPPRGPGPGGPGPRLASRRRGSPPRAGSRGGSPGARRGRGPSLRPGGPGRSGLPPGPPPPSPGRARPPGTGPPRPPARPRFQPSRRVPPKARVGDGLGSADGYLHHVEEEVSEDALGVPEGLAQERQENRSAREDRSARYPRHPGCRPPRHAPAGTRPPAGKVRPASPRTPGRPSPPASGPAGRGPGARGRRARRGAARQRRPDPGRLRSRPAPDGGGPSAPNRTEA